MQTRTDKKAKGDLGEDYIAAELQKRGHMILHRNFRKSYGEIDIISQVGNTIVFTEVKTRRRNPLVSGLEAVTAAKRKKIVLTADFYLCNVYPTLAKPTLQPRYDIAVVTITQGDNPIVVSSEIYENAFTADGIYTLY